MQLNDVVSNSPARSYSHVKEVVKHELSGRFRHKEETLKKNYVALNGGVEIGCRYLNGHKKSGVNEMKLFYPTVFY